VLDKTNLADPAVVADIVAFRPSDLQGPTAEAHLMPLLLIGLRSSKTDMLTFDLIRRLTSVPDAELIDDANNRLLHGFVAALPWMLHSTDLGEPNEDLAGMASDLADIAERKGNASLARLLTSFARARFRTKDDFIRQAASHLRERLVSHGLEITTLLLGFVLNQNDWMRDKALQMLKLVLSFPEAQALAPHSPQLVRPLLRLVSTKHAATALDVLELPFAQVDPTGLESTDQLFGPFEASGWSIPNSAERSEVTRANVSAVFNTCAVETRAASAHFSVLQFSDIRAAGITKHEAWGASEGSLELPSPPISVSDNASMGDLVGALHSLNQFFDEGLDLPGSTSPLAARRLVQTHFARVSSTDSLGVARVMARGMGMGRKRSEADSEVYVLASEHGYGFSTDSFNSSADGMPRPSSSQAQHGGFYNGNGNGSSGGNGHILGQSTGLAAAFTPMPTQKRQGGPYVHAAHQPSFSSESEFDGGDNVFSLDDAWDFSNPNLGASVASVANVASVSSTNVSGVHARRVDSGSGSGTAADDSPDEIYTPVRPWNSVDPSRTPSPRDGTAL
jgi:hypothetical protein